MISVIHGDSGKPIKNWASDLEGEAEAQLIRLARLPFIHNHVAVMPDAHAGKGSTVGTVIATKGAIIPAAVGVDIGCGMCAVKLPIRAKELGNPDALMQSIEWSVPTGHRGNQSVTDRMQEALNGLGVLSEVGNKVDFKRAELQLGTLGGGNHFIEICTDTEGGAWVMLHSGSRHLGKSLADIHIDRAKGLMKEYFISLPDPDLAYLAQGTREFNDYMKDLHFAQRYAKANRNEMMLRVLKDISFHVFGEDRGAEFMTVLRVDCHHNYTNQENHGGQNVWVTRKGAISAREGELGIIPGSMGAKSFIVRGRGNLDSFTSCSHGAGRKMSRTKARQTFTVQDLEDQTRGVVCRKDQDVLDEIPSSYKNIDEVMANQVDLVTPLYELKQLICVKGNYDGD